MTKSLKRHLMTKCIQDNMDCWKTTVNSQVQTQPFTNQRDQPACRSEESNVLKHNSFGMDLSRVADKQQLTNKELTNSTSETSSRSNSVDGGLTIVDNEFTSPNHSSTLNSTDSNFVSLANCPSTIAYTNCQTSALSNTATYNVNQDFLIRMAMQNNTSANSSIVSNNMFHSNKLYNDNLAAVAAAVANGNSHSLYQQALNVTSNSTQNNSAISAAHHLAALNSHSPHSSAFQNLQNAHSSQLQSTQPTNSTTNGQLTNGHSTSHTTSNAPIADHLLSTMTNGTLNGVNQRMNITSNLINPTTSLSSTSNLSNNGSTNSSSTSSSSNGSLNSSHLALNEQILNPNLILASQSSFVPSTLMDTSPNNLFSGIKKRKRSPQPIPQDLKDDAYWDRRRRNNESAKRSREVRRIKEHGIALRLAYLEKRNLQLTTELEMMREEAKKMHDIIYCQRYGQNSQHDKHL